MSVTFTKLFSSITESTVWCEPDHVRLLWITMLAMSDRNGRVWGSIPGLANRARIPVEAARDAIARFLSPDPDSRTPDNEGRRIEAIDGGWRLLNHEKYRALRDEESIKESKRKYINKRREEERKAGSVENVDRSRDNAEAYTEAEAVKTSSRTKSATAPAPGLEVRRKTWEAYSDAYEFRYGVPPASNAPARSAIKRFCSLLPAEECPAVAAYYVSSSNSFYVSKGHNPNFLAADAAKLRTEWATGNQITQTQAMQADKTASRKSVFTKLINEVENGK